MNCSIAGNKSQKVQKKLKNPVFFTKMSTCTHAGISNFTKNHNFEIVSVINGPEVSILFKKAEKTAKMIKKDHFFAKDSGHRDKKSLKNQ